MKTKITTKIVAILLLIIAGYFSACTNTEIETKGFGSEKIETRAVEFLTSHN